MELEAVAQATAVLELLVGLVRTLDLTVVMETAAITQREVVAGLAALTIPQTAQQEQNGGGRRGGGGGGSSTFGTQNGGDGGTGPNTWACNAGAHSGLNAGAGGGGGNSGANGNALTSGSWW